MRLHKLLIKLSQMGSIFIEIFDVECDFLPWYIYIKAIRYKHLFLNLIL